MLSHLVRHLRSPIRTGRLLTVDNINYRPQFAQKSSGSRSNGGSRRGQRRSGWWWWGAVPAIATGATALTVYVVCKKTNTNLAKVKPREALSEPRNDSSDEEFCDLERPANRKEPKSRRRRLKRQRIDLQDAIDTSRDLCLRIKDETGAPGLSIVVMIDGQEVWSEGFGFADLENRVPCRPETVMRIASISKPIAMTIVAKLVEQGKLDLDKPVADYVPEWPQKTHQGEPVTITTRHLVSHLAGIRHYKKKPDAETTGSKTTAVVNKQTDPDDDLREFYSSKQYDDVVDALAQFKDDDLFHKPNTTFLYTTHGFTLLSAVAQKAADKKFSQLLRDLFRDLGLENTHLDENTPLIYNRARQYVKNKTGRVTNSPFVNNSNKWAGGGLLSTAADVARFGGAMLYSRQAADGYLRRETVAEMWTPVARTRLAWDADGGYGMGWGVVRGGRRPCRHVMEYYGHTGGAVGGSSVLVVQPRPGEWAAAPPRGVVVAMVTNLGSVGLNKTAKNIAKIFDKVDVE